MQRAQQAVERFGAFVGVRRWRKLGR